MPERIRNSVTKYFAPRCSVPLQKAWARVRGKHTIPWQSLGEDVRRPRRREVAKQELVQEEDGQVDVLPRRFEVAKVFHSGVLCDELVLLWRVLQPAPGSLETTVRQTRRAAKGRRLSVALAALHRNEGERAVETIDLHCGPFLAETHKQLAQRRHHATAGPLVSPRGVHAWARNAIALLRPIGTQVTRVRFARLTLHHLM